MFGFDVPSFDVEVFRQGGGVRDPPREPGGRGPRGQGGQVRAVRRGQHGTPRHRQPPPLLG